MSLHSFCLVFFFCCDYAEASTFGYCQTLLRFFHLSLATLDICYTDESKVAPLNSKTWKVKLRKSLASSSWFYKLFLRSPNSLHGF